MVTVSCELNMDNDDLQYIADLCYNATIT